MNETPAHSAGNGTANPQAVANPVVDRQMCSSLGPAQADRLLQGSLDNMHVSRPSLPLPSLSVSPPAETRHGSSTRVRA